MKVTFPHMGTIHLSIATLLADVGLEPVVPPPTSRRTLDLGVKCAPEFACFPLKVNLGNYLEAIAAGAEAILMVGGVGPCRLGYYAEIQREILERLGHGIVMVALEPPQHRWRELWTAVSRIVPRKRRIGPALLFAYRKIKAVDGIERLVNRVRAHAVEPAAAEAAWTACQAALAPVMDYAGLAAAVRGCRERLEAVPVEADRPLLRVELAGEIFMVLEPAVNFQIERALGERGALVERHIYLGNWIEDQLLRNFVSRAWRAPIEALARPYLGNFVGGHGLESVAQAVNAAVNRVDGLIHLAPFTCMPEIIAQSVLPGVGRGLGLPVMSLIIDEHSAEAGILTRIEAFLDLLARRRAKGNPYPEPGLLPASEVSCRT